jgi:hypothetical protein
MGRTAALYLARQLPAVSKESHRTAAVQGKISTLQDLSENWGALL